MPRSHRPRFTLPRKGLHLTGLACGAVSIGVVGALLLGPSPVDPGKAPDQEPPEGSIVGKRFEDVATAELTGVEGKTETPEFVARQVIIGFEPDATPAQREAAIASVDGEVKERLPMPGVVLIRLDGRLGVETAQQKIDTLAGVRYAEPNVIYRLSDTTPTDPHYPFLWGMENTGQEVLGVRGTLDADIDAGAAWDITKGSSDIVAAVVDTGVDFEHEDLAQQIWANSADPKNGVDDDRNGYIDDTNGWDFINGDGRPDDDHYHGTHVAGTIAARTDDGKGVVGVAPNTTVMPVKVLGSSGSGSNAGVASGFAYAARMGARVVNASLGCSGSSCFSQTMLDVIKANPNTLYVIAAGNSSADTEQTPHYPCAYDAANIICVAATDSSDRLASFSNWGVSRVDVGAPGVKVLSDIPGIETAPTRKIIFYEDFEKPLAGNWIKQGTEGVWQVTDEKAYSGSGSLTDRPYEPYRSNDNAWVYTPPFSLKDEVNCTWGMDAIHDIPIGDEGVSGRYGLSIDIRQGLNHSYGFSGGYSGVLRFSPRSPASLSSGYSNSSEARIGVNLSAGGSNRGRGVFADNILVTCEDTSPRPAPPSRYGYLNGTSMATPHVAGVAALVAARYPQMSALEIKQRILDTVDPVSSLAGITVTGGRVNAARAVGGSNPTTGSLRKASTRGLPSEPRPVETSLYGSGALRIGSKLRMPAPGKQLNRHRKRPAVRVVTNRSGASQVSTEMDGSSAVVESNADGLDAAGSSIPGWTDDIYRLLPAQKNTHLSQAGAFPMVDGQWGLDNVGQLGGKPDADIDAPEAWQVTKGSPEVTVAVLSTGMAHNLPSLRGKNFTNRGEMGDGRETNGIDDDRNGYVDDWRGGGPSDVLNTDSVLDARGTPFNSNIEDNQGEGTVLASSIASDPGNEAGIRGVSPGVKILPIRTKSAGGDLPPNGSSTGNMGMYRGINYAGRIGADIVVLPDDNNVMGSSRFTSLISTYPKSLFVATSAEFGLLAACRTGLPNLICVGGSNNSDAPGPFLGGPGVNLAVPGVNLVAEGQQWEYRMAEDFEGSVRNYSHDGAEAGWQVQEGIGLGGSRGLAVVRDADLPRGKTTHALFEGNLDVPGDLSACGISAWITRGPASDHVMGIKAGGWEWGYRWETSNSSTFGRYRQLTSMVGGNLLSMSREKQQTMSLYSSSAPNAWTAREAFDNIGYVCPVEDPSGFEVAAVDRPLGHKHVEGAYTAGVAALVKSENPGFGPVELKKAILDGADRVPTLASAVPEGRRLNAAGALAAAAAATPVAAPPKTRVLNVPIPATNNRRPTLRFEVLRASSVECSLDSGLAPDWVPCDANGTFTPASDLTDGTWTFRVRATNGDGSTSDSKSFVVDTVAPAAPVFTQGAFGPTNLVGPTSIYVSGELNARFRCRLDPVSEWQPCDDLTGTSGRGMFRREAGLPDGDYTIHFTQTDLAGNVSPEVSRTINLDTKPPGPLTITSAPPPFIRSSIATFSWALPEPGPGSIGVAVDGGSRGNYYTSGTSWTFRGFSEGPHTFAFYARDLAGNYSTEPVTRTFTLDTIAPGAPSLQAPPAVTNGSPRISFNGEDGASFECQLDAGTYSACGSPWTRTDLTDGSHTLRVRQIDRAGNTGTASAQHTWTVDSTPPPAPSVSSSPSGTTMSDEARIDFSGETGAKFLCSFNDGDFEECVSPFSLSRLRDGLQTLRIRQLDAAGNESEAVTHTWSVDTTAPNAPSINSSPSGTVASPSAEIRFSGEEGATFTCSIDGSGFSPCASPKTFSDLADGSHTVRVRQRDEAGNTSASSEVTWTVDTGAPSQPELTSVPPSLTASPSAEFTFVGEQGAEFKCSIDGSAFSACSSPKTYSNLRDGSHRFELRQTDPAGHTSPVVSHVWTVAEVLGRTAAVSGPDANGLLTFSGAGDRFSYLCRVNSMTAPLEPCQSPLAPVGLVNGTYPVRVAVVDADGTRSAITQTNFTISGAPAPPSGQVGVSVNDAAIFTNNPMVNLNLVWPAGARQVIVSNDGSLNGAPSGVTAHMPWLLASSGVERLPKTVYVRFLGAGGTALTTVQDDIILDQTAPAIRDARIQRRVGSTYTFFMSSTEQGSGLSAIEISTAVRKPADSISPKVTSPYRGGTFTKRFDLLPTWLRLRDAAGNWSAWVRITN